MGNVMKLLLEMVFLSSIISWANPLSADSIKKPDLVIENVSYKQMHYGIGWPSGVIGGTYFEFTLRIKNIGTADFTHDLFISNTRSERDINVGHYSHGQIAYYDTTLRTHTIAPGEVIQVRVDDAFDLNISRVKFLIYTDGKPHIKKSKVPRVEELNYDNNTYEVQIKREELKKEM